MKKKVDLKELKGGVLLLSFISILCIVALWAFLVIDTKELVGFNLFIDDETGRITYVTKEVIPVVRIEMALSRPINKYQAYLEPNSLLGWRIKNSTQYGDYISNSIGIRSPKEFSLEKDEEVIRIQIFGDSFAHGNDVPYNETMAYHFEEMMNSTNDVEVMNFGVPAYGTDQAYLRWKLEGTKYNPDIVIIGIQPENCERNMNMLSGIYFYFFPHITKPRFILENDEMILINYPTMETEELIKIVKEFDEWSLKEYECKYIENREKGTCNNEHRDTLCFNIIKKWFEEASENSEVYLVYLPHKDYLTEKIQQNTYKYESIIERINQEISIINPENELIEEADYTSIDSLYVGHFSNKSNFIVAKKIYEQIVQNLE